MNSTLFFYMIVGIVGLGFVGSAMYKSFGLKGVSLIGYDKYKDGGISSLENILKCDIVFLCLPTLFNEDTKQYDKSAIYEVCGGLVNNNYEGLVVLKSTVEPETINKLSIKYNLKLCHNPEFLTARTAYEDFHSQKHIVLGKGNNCSEEDMNSLKEFYKTNYPEAEISLCDSLESESMKIMCNSFYASKIMIFNEYAALCKNNGCNFEKVRDLMLKNKWINHMHTIVPGTDGKLGYGGACFPKDTLALREYMSQNGSINNVLSSVIEENTLVRSESELSNNLKLG